MPAAPRPAIWPFLLIAVPLAVSLSGQQPVFRAGVDLVHFAVVVTDRQGNLIEGLSPGDFEVREDGVRQDVRFFAVGDPDALPPMRLGFLLDTSGSMEADIREVRTAVIKFLNENDQAADVTLVEFDSEVRAARFAPEDFPRLIERIRMRKPEGWTSFYDALAVYLRAAAGQEGQKVLVAFTDGEDTRSSLTHRDALDLLKATDVTLYAIGYLEGQRSSSRMQQRVLLQQFAEATGGAAFFPTSLRDLDRMYERIQQELSMRYTLGYLSTNTQTDGAWRSVDIRLTRPDLRGARVRTRSGYFAPYRESQD